MEPKEETQNGFFVKTDLKERWALFNMVPVREENNAV
jgi:hypothetical protein